MKPETYAESCGYYTAHYRCVCGATVRETTDTVAKCKACGRTEPESDAERRELKKGERDGED